MKHLLLYLLILCCSLASISQNTGIGVGTTNPHASAELEVNSTSRGFLPPRMNFAERNSIANPAAGLIIYCTDCGTAGEMQYFNGSRWVFMTIVGGSDPVIVTTNQVSSIAWYSASCGGNVSYSNDAMPVNTRGICWSTSPNPTISLSTKTIDGSGSGPFTSTLSNLSPNSSYFVRAYATNINGTSYGPSIFFSTPALTINDPDLPSVTIGTQIWQSKNLDVPTYRNGNAIPQVTDASQWENLTTGAWCWYNNDSATYAATYGRLYNWYAVADPRRLCPTGWHVPTDAEWTTLENQLGGLSVAGGVLKSSTGWNSPNTGATNSSGFSGLPGGYRGSLGNFDYIGDYGIFWSSAEYNSNFAWFRMLFYSNSDVLRLYDVKQFGFSVRCLRD